MKKEELRIGNLVNEEVLGDCPISDICEHVVMVKVNNGELDGTISKVTYTLNYHCINPIPITEQWLLDFGFETNETEGDLWYFKENDSCAFGLAKRSETWLFYMANSKVDYVHEVQNLYYALTNKELKTK